MMWLARDAFLGAAYYSGAGGLFRVFAGRRRGVVSFHNVLPPGMMTGANVYRVDVPADVFRKQLRYVAAHWPILTAERIADPEADGFFLTFDDGMLNAYTNVAPTLKEYGLTAMFAVCPGLVEGEIPHLWRDHVFLILTGAVGGSLLLPVDGGRRGVEVTVGNVGSLARRVWDHVVRTRADAYATVRQICSDNHLAYERSDFQPERFHPLTWDAIRDIRSQGHVIASHTWSHPILRLLDRKRRRQELCRSKSVLEDRLGESVRCIVYPYGGPAEVDADCMRLAGECGYRTGFMNVPHPPPGPKNMNVARFSLPATCYRPHLHATMSGLKDLLNRPRRDKP